MANLSPRANRLKDDAPNSIVSRTYSIRAVYTIKARSKTKCTSVPLELKSALREGGKIGKRDVEVCRDAEEECLDRALGPAGQGSLKRVISS